MDGGSGSVENITDPDPAKLCGYSVPDPQH